MYLTTNYDFSMLPARYQRAVGAVACLFAALCAYNLAYYQLSTITEPKFGYNSIMIWMNMPTSQAVRNKTNAQARGNWFFGKFESAIGKFTSKKIKPKTTAPAIEHEKIALLTFYSRALAPRMYARSLETLRCYAKRHNYTLIEVVSEELRGLNADCRQKDVFFRKHCLIAAALRANPHLEWFYVLDADTGVANPDHKLQEFIDPTVDLIFYERFYIWEIAAGNYIARNTNFTRQFLVKWSNMEPELPKGRHILTSHDNGALHLLLLRTVYADQPLLEKNCSEWWYKGRFFPYVWCTNHYLRQRRCTDHFRFLRRAHAWVIDRHIVSDRWSDEIFMEHGWKNKYLDKGQWSLNVGAQLFDVNNRTILTFCSEASRQQWCFPSGAIRFHNHFNDLYFSI